MYLYVNIERYNQILLERVVERLLENRRTTIATLSCGGRGTISRRPPPGHVAAPTFFDDGENSCFVYQHDCIRKRCTYIYIYMRCIYIYIYMNRYINNCLHVYKNAYKYITIHIHIHMIFSYKYIHMKTKIYI